MTEQTPIASVPVAWLKPVPASYRIPLWRWVLPPATTFMLKRRGGVWVSGTLTLTATELRFTQTKVLKSASVPETWALPLDDISRAVVARGMASETIEVHHANGIARLMTARAGGFIDHLHAAIPAG